MARVPITVIGFRCERCAHEWIPRGGVEEEPRVCPKCHSPWWNRSRKAMMTYDDFRVAVLATLTKVGEPLTWTDIRTRASLPQAFPNNQWIHRLERDIGLRRRREAHGIVLWELTKEVNIAASDKPSPKASIKARTRKGREQSALE